LNNPIAEEITPSLIGKLRNDYLNKNTEKTTINKYIQYLDILFNQLIKLKIWTKENPIKDIKPLKTKELDIRYLSTDEIKELLEVLSKSSSKSVLNVTKICLATGARWSEAENLTKSQIGNDRVTFIKTKNGKSRTVPLDSSLCSELKSYENDKIFKSCYCTFNKYLKKCSFKVREHQASHVLRHTFASHFIANGGNLIVLKEILGHSDIKMTMIYAHYSPEHLEQVKSLNPLNSLTLS
jgi:site-specific recombinase XerD